MATSIIANPLTNLFNYCIATYPKVLKSAEKKMSAYYRPITLLLPFSEIFENCLHKQIYSFLQVTTCYISFNIAVGKNIY